MKTDTEIRTNGLQALIHELGILDAERFIALIQREPFDYSHWQVDLWTEQSVDDISKSAMTMRKGKKNRGAKPPLE